MNKHKDNKKGCVYWITGLSGAGKTTIGTLLYNYIYSKKENVIFLDGDVLRDVYQSHDYSDEGRRKLAFQNSRLCKMLSDQGVDVVICLIAMYESCREWNRNNIEKYKEIYLQVPIEKLIERDQKQLYSRALREEVKNVMGIDISYEEPLKPTLKIDNSGILSPEEVFEIIVNQLDIMEEIQ